MRERPDTPRFSAALEDHLRSRVGEEHDRRARRRRRRVPVAASGVAVVTAIAVLVGVGTDQSAREARATAFVIDGRVIDARTLLDTARHEELRDRFAQAGAELVIKLRPVADSAVGTVFSVDYPKGARVDDQGRLAIKSDLRGPVTVTVGVPSPVPTTKGESIYKTLPGLCSLVTPTDAPATVKALRDAGYEVQVKEITFRAGGADSRDVDKPPVGTLVIGVLNAQGKSFDVPPETRRLVVEVGRGGHGHHGQPDGACAPPKRVPPAGVEPQNPPPRGQGGGSQDHEPPEVIRNAF